MAFARTGDKYHDLWISTLPFYEKKLIDMLPRSHPLLSRIAGNNNVKAKTLKGKRFVETILARTIDAVTSIDLRDSITTQTYDLLETVEVEPKLLYQGVTVYDKEVAINNSNSLQDLVSINQKAVREGFTRSFARTIYESGGAGANPSFNMNGLAYLISENPYATNLVCQNLTRGLTSDAGNTSPGGTQEFWRNRAGEWVITAATTNLTPTQWNWDLFEDCGSKLINAMTMMILVLNGVSDVASAEKIDPLIDSIYMNYRLYNLYQQYKYKYLHLNNVPEQKVDLGFIRAEFMGVPVYLDKNCPMNKIYFLDSSQIDLLYIPGENFKHFVKEIPEKLAKRYLTSFMGNYMIHKARNCGVLTINTTTNNLPSDCNICNPSAYVDYDYKQPDATANPETIENSNYSGSGEPEFKVTPPYSAPGAKKQQRSNFDSFIFKKKEEAKSSSQPQEPKPAAEASKETPKQDAKKK